MKGAGAAIEPAAGCSLPEDGPLYQVCIHFSLPALDVALDFFAKKRPASSRLSRRREVESALYNSFSDWFGRDRFAAR